MRTYSRTSLTAALRRATKSPGEMTPRERRRHAKALKHAARKQNK